MMIQKWATARARARARAKEMEGGRAKAKARARAEEKETTGEVRERVRERVLGVGGGGVVIKAEKVWQLVLLGLRTGLRFQDKVSTLLVAGRRGKISLVGESGTGVPLLTSTPSAPWPPCQASAGMLHIQSFPRQ